MTTTLDRRHPCAVTTAGLAPADCDLHATPAAPGDQVPTTPVRVDLIPDLFSAQVALSLYGPDGRLHPRHADVTVVLNRAEAEQLRDALTGWLVSR